MSTGVKASGECKKAYDEMYNRKQYQYIIFKLSPDEKEIIVESIGKKGAPYKEFADAMEKAIDGGKDCRYACVDVEFSFQRQGTDAASHIQKVVFVQCCPDSAPVRKRMIYAGSVRSLKAALGLDSLVQIQAADATDFDEKAVKSELMSTQRR